MKFPTRHWKLLPPAWKRLLSPFQFIPFTVDFAEVPKAEMPIVLPDVRFWRYRGLSIVSYDDVYRKKLEFHSDRFLLTTRRYPKAASGIGIHGWQSASLDSSIALARTRLIISTFFRHLIESDLPRSGGTKRTLGIAALKEGYNAAEEAFG